MRGIPDVRVVSTRKETVGQRCVVRYLLKKEKKKLLEPRPAKYELWLYRKEGRKASARNDDEFAVLSGHLDLLSPKIESLQKTAHLAEINAPKTVLRDRDGFPRSTVSPRECYVHTCIVDLLLSVSVEAQRRRA
jgi:hypothetical protein